MVNTSKVSRFLSNVDKLRGPVRIIKSYKSLLEEAEDLIKAVATIGTVHKWKSGWYQKTSVKPSKWMPVKKQGGKWIKDESREQLEEGASVKEHLQTNEVKEPKGRTSSALPPGEKKGRGRTKAKHWRVRETASQGKIFTDEFGRTWKYSGNAKQGESLSETEKEHFREQGEKLEIKDQEKKKKESQAEKPAATEKKGRGRTSDPLYLVKERGANNQKLGQSLIPQILRNGLNTTAMLRRENPFQKMKPKSLLLLQ